MPIRVLIADDHSLFRHGLKVLLENAGFDVIAEAASGREAAELAEVKRPDVAVLDLFMPEGDGVEAAIRIRQSRPEIRIIILTGGDPQDKMAQVSPDSVHGYVPKSAACGDLIDAIREVARGAVYLSGGWTRRTKALTARERHVLQLVASGKSNSEIASLLGVSTKTVEAHRRHIMRKLRITETAHLVRYAIRAGLLQV
jgi:DNA-binding NarL/FixJ family response regulator